MKWTVTMEAGLTVFSRTYLIQMFFKNIWPCHFWKSRHKQLSSCRGWSKSIHNVSSLQSLGHLKRTGYSNLHWSNRQRLVWVCSQPLWCHCSCTLSTKLAAKPLGRQKNALPCCNIDHNWASNKNLSKQDDLLQLQNINDNRAGHVITQYLLWYKHIVFKP